MMVRPRRLWLWGAVAIGLGACSPAGGVQQPPARPTASPPGPARPKGRPPVRAVGGWRTVDVEGRFSFSIPTELQRHRVAAIDSLVRQYRGPTMQVALDYGWYSDDLARYHGRVQRIDGREAKIVTFRQARAQLSFGMAVHFMSVAREKRRSPDKLTIFVIFSQVQQRPVATRILQSVRFPD